MDLKKQDTMLAEQNNSLIKSYRENYPKSISEAIQAQSDCLSVIRKDKGEKVCIAFLILVVTDCVKFFSVGKSMNDSQVVETAKLIMNEFYFLKVSDLQIFFSRFKTGFYGELFDRIDGHAIMTKLREYVDERMEVAERISLEKHKEILETERQEQYLIKVGEYWVRSDGDDFTEVETKEMATAYTYGVAVKLKGWITREYYHTTPEKVKICDKKKAGSFFDHLEKNAPQLLPIGEKYRRATSEYFIMKQKILADTDLTPFEKENAIRRLANLEPVSGEEWNNQFSK